MAREAGFNARYPDDCPRCGRPILPGHRVARSGRLLVHVQCAPGADDE